MLTLASQASVAVGGVNTGVAGQLTGVTWVTQVIVGAVSSTTEMVRLQVEELPQSSVAVQVRVTMYSGGQVPGVFESLKVMATLASQASVAVGGVNTGVAGQLTGVTWVTQVIVGAVSSTTEMVRLQVEELPQSSLAVQVRVTMYSAGQVPGVFESLNVMETLASQASVAVGGVNTGVAGQLTGVTWVTQVMVGAVSSTTEMARLQVEEFPQSSEAV